MLGMGTQGQPEVRLELESQKGRMYFPTEFQDGSPEIM